MDLTLYQRWNMAPEMMEVNALPRKGKLRLIERQTFVQGHIAGVVGHPVSPVLPACQVSSWAQIRKAASLIPPPWPGASSAQPALPPHPQSTPRLSSQQALSASWMAWSGQLPTGLLLDSPPARNGPAQRLRTERCPHSATATDCLGATRPSSSVPRWGRSSPVSYPFKPGRDGSCQRQPRLARDVAAGQAERSRKASG